MIALVLTTTTLSAVCPLCHQPATRVHSRYMRTVADLPWAGIGVRLHLNVRRFFCDNRDCTRTVFAERPGSTGCCFHSFIRGPLVWGAFCNAESHSAVALPGGDLPAPRFEVYRAVSQQVMAIFQVHTALVEPLSLDEAYLDVTAAAHNFEKAARLAREIKQQI